MLENDNKIYLVTGATAGVGKATARILAEKGGTVVVVSRNADKCAATAEEIKQTTGNGGVAFIQADLSSQQDIGRLARQFLDRYSRLDALVNNAGALFTSRQVSVDGIEMTWALNHLNYFLLTHLLMPVLKAAPAARVVNVSSDAHRMARLNFDDLEGKKRYSGWMAYGQSKLANIMFTYELARRLSGTAITTNALHPGLVASDFGVNNGLFGRLYRKVANLFALKPEEGAQTSIYLATSPEVEGITGRYFEKCKEKPSSSVSYDQDDWTRLWQVSAEMAKL
jgi:NAD(P)-dependent dehydrogenase (short-subunit alcohol dehydrogenase family)